MKKVLLVNGSPHKNGTTAAALHIVETVLLERGVEIEWFQLDGKPVRGCIACERCAEEHRCTFRDDQCNELIEAMLRADAVMIGTPVYFAGPNGALCALLDRVFYAASTHGQMFAGKPAAAVAVCWRAGTTAALDRLNKYFTYSQMPVVSSRYWNNYFSEEDRFGASVLRTLAGDMAEMLEK